MAESLLTPGFIVAQSHRLESLTELVVDLTTSLPLPPLVNEQFLVQSNGMAQWLKQELAARTGIAAMQDMTLPASFTWQLYRTVLGEHIPQHSPFDKERLLWRILRLLPQCAGEPAFLPLAQYIRHDPDLRKRYQLSQRLADLFDQYQIYRADWLTDWANGGNRFATGDNAWQPALWRKLLSDTEQSEGMDASWQSRAGLHRRFIETAAVITLEQRPSAAPLRVIVFGISSLPQQILEVLDAIKGFCQIVLCVHNPSKYHWADIVDGRDLLRQMNIHHRRQPYKAGMTEQSDDITLHTQAHPLLASWGKQGRDYIRLLDKFDETRLKAAHFNELSFELFDDGIPQTMLAQLQQDILELRPVSESRALWQGQADRSIAFHICHSPQREVEVLHDQLLAAFAADSQLKPRDIMVMVPDINSYAPYIHAVFGRVARQDARYIPFTLADQGQRQQEPLLIALENILQAPQSRFTMTDIISLLQVPALRQRFGFDEASLPLLLQWCRDAGIRWGLNAKQRATLDLPAELEQNSWWFGLRRMLLGYACGDSAAWQQTEPFADISGSAAAAVGPLFQLLDSLENIWLQLQQSYTPPQWHDCFSQLLADLFNGQTEKEQQILHRLQQTLTEWLQACQQAGFNEALPLTVAREAWLENIEQQRLTQRFMSGSVNFATLMPMRAIPFKLVCLLGMNDGEYPRTIKPLEFDLMAQDYRPGDRSRREDDRYLFLEALLSARQKMYISWVGRSVRDNSEKPPSVLVSQLREHLVAGWAQSGQSEKSFLQKLTTEHKLQPFNPAYFQASQPASDYFSFAAEWQNVHQLAPAAMPLAAEVSSWLPEGALTIRQLTDFMREPARLFFNLRLQTYFYQQDEQHQDEENFTLDRLDHWQLQHELVQQVQIAHQQQHDVDHCIRQTLQRFANSGRLAIGSANTLIQQTLYAESNQIYQQLQQATAGYQKETEPYFLSYQYRQLTIEDYCHSLYQQASGERMYLHLTAASVDSKTLSAQLLQAWVTHLLLNSQTPVKTMIISRNSSITLPQISQQAVSCLQPILDAVIQGLGYPLPVEMKTAACWLQQKDKDPMAAARLYDEGGFNQPAQVKQAVYCGRVYPDAAALMVSGQFNQLAETLYLPLLQWLQPQEDT